jgi:hypothetical protein
VPFYAHIKENKMISKKTILAVFGTLMCLLSFAGIAAADSLNDIQFIMISADDAMATIKKADGSLQVIQPGDVIADTYTVKRIKAGKIVLENSSADGPKIVFVRVMNGQQRLESRGNNRPQTGPPLPAMPGQQ